MWRGGSYTTDLLVRTRTLLVGRFDAHPVVFTTERRDIVDEPTRLLFAHGDRLQKPTGNPDGCSPASPKPYKGVGSGSLEPFGV